MTKMWARWVLNSVPDGPPKMRRYTKNRKKIKKKQNEAGYRGSHQKPERGSEGLFPEAFEGTGPPTGLEFELLTFRTAGQSTSVVWFAQVVAALGNHPHFCCSCSEHCSCVCHCCVLSTLSCSKPDSSCRSRLHLLRWGLGRLLCVGQTTQLSVCPSTCLISQ